MKLQDDVREYMWEWLRQYTNDKCIVRIPPWEKRLPGRKKGTYYSWQFYLRRGLFNSTYLNYVGMLFWDHFADLYRNKPFQIAGLETGSTPLIVGLTMTAPVFDISVNSFSIRANRKKYGLKNRFEGNVLDLPVLIVDDLSNSKETIYLARQYCQEENVPLLDQIFTVVHKDSDVNGDKTKTINTIVHNNEVYNSLFTLNNFDLNFVNYNLKKNHIQQDTPQLNYIIQ